MRLREIRDLSSADRAKKLVDLRAELARLRTMVAAGGAVEDPTKLRELRKTIAQILTVETETKLNAEKPTEKQDKKPKKKQEQPAKKARAKKEVEETSSQ